MPNALQTSQSPEEAHSFFILDTARDIKAAHSERDVHKLYSAVTIGLDLVSPVMDLAVKMRIEDDNKTMKKKLAELYERKVDAEGTMEEKKIKAQIDALEWSFSEAHMNAVFTAMTRTSLFSPKTEGLIEIKDKEALDKLARSIRGPSKEDYDKAKENQEKAE